MSIIGISGKIGHGKDTVGNIIRYLTTYPNQERSYNSYIIDIGCDSNPNEHYKWQIKKYGGKLKDMVCMLIGCTREQLEDNTFKETPLGEEWGIWRGSVLDFVGEYINFPQAFISEEECTNYAVKHWQGHKLHISYERLTPRKLLQLIGTECGRKIIHPNLWCNSLFSEYKPKVNEYFLGKQQLTYPNWIITDVRFPNEAKAIKDRSGLVIRVNNPRIQSNDIHESETALDLYNEFDYTITNDKRIEELINKVELVLERANLLK